MKIKLHITLFSEEGLAKSIVISKACFKRVVRGATLLLIIFCALGIAGLKLFLNGWQSNITAAQQTEEIAGNPAEAKALHQEVTSLDQAQKELLQDTVRKLDEKNKILDSVLNAAGVKPKTRETGANSGGRFTSLASYPSLAAQSQPLSAEEVLARVDRYIETVQTIPLGIPVSGAISSGFGRRFDPLNNNPAFHEGVDIRGPYGAKIKATADGKVRDRGYHGAYGWFVEVDHGNGFVTMFCHLKKILVNDGEPVTRGQAIGLLGNSGRTTGAHVHYEIRHKGRPVNPRSFMAVSAKSLSPKG